MRTIDGAKGEGGGQIVRTSLALSLVTGEPVRIVRVRAGRKRPGLLRQHLAAVKAAQAVGAAVVEGASLGSSEVTFRPQAVLGGELQLKVGSAGSATLVLQTVLPALLAKGVGAHLVLEGGTHNPFAPPFPFLDRAYLPMVRRLGGDVHAAIERPGFYPAGGGRFQVTVAPGARLGSLDLLERGPVERVLAEAVVSALPPEIGRREVQVLQRELGLARGEARTVEVKDPVGPGNAVVITVRSAHVVEVVTSFGERRVRAEDVAAGAARAARRYRDADVAVGEHLADQLVLLLALGGGGSFTTLAPTGHTRTHLSLLADWLGRKGEVERLGEDRFLIRIG